jgi:flagellar FliL protein
LLDFERMAEDMGTRKSSGPGRAWTVLLPVLVVAAIGGWFWLHRAGEATAQAGGETRIASTLHLDTFVLNLADTEQRSYLRVGIDLGLNRELKRDEPAPVAQVRDTILGVLAEGKVDELMTPAGKTKLKDNLLRALKERVPQLGVEEVYFTEFLVQR